MLQEGLEPPTLGLLDPCSTKLSYQSVMYCLTLEKDTDTLPEWLRGQPAKLVSFARTGSNPVGVGSFSFSFFIQQKINKKMIGERFELSPPKRLVP